MRKIDNFALQAFNETVFFDQISTMFKTGFDWGTLCHLINDDYLDILKCDPTVPKQFSDNPVEWMFDRYDLAFVKTGKIPARFFELKKRIAEDKYKQFVLLCTDLASTLLKEKYQNIPKSLEGKTVVFEFSRGGAKGATFPLSEPYGYQYSLS